MQEKINQEFAFLHGTSVIVRFTQLTEEGKWYTVKQWSGIHAGWHNKSLSTFWCVWKMPVIWIPEGLKTIFSSAQRLSFSSFFTYLRLYHYLILVWLIKKATSTSDFSFGVYSTTVICTLSGLISHLGSINPPNYLCFHGNGFYTCLSIFRKG